MLSQAIQATSSDLVSAFAKAGVTVVRAHLAMPYIHVRGRRDQLKAIGSDPRIKLMMAQGTLTEEARCHLGPDKTLEFEEGTETPACDVDGNVFHHLDTVFNAGGNVADHYPVANLEAGLQDKTILDTHEAFKFAKIIYFNPSAPGFDPSLASVQHGTAVTSLIASSNDGKVCGAAGADIYMYNGNGSYCNGTATIDAYEWMAMQGDNSNPIEDPPIAAINESWGCGNSNGACDINSQREKDGVTQDWYARFADTMTVKAGGNQNCGISPLTHPACPFTLNSLCVGATADDGLVSCDSSFTNPTLNNNSSSDREEPDLVALGGNNNPPGAGGCKSSQLGQTGVSQAYNRVCIASPDGDEVWTGAAGTSLASPIVTSLITLFRERCEPEYGARVNQRFMRAILKAASFGGNPMDTAYSTPRPGEDFHDGAGLIFAEALGDCSPLDGTHGGDLVVDLGGGIEMPEGDPRYIDEGYNPPGETQNFNNPLAFNYQPGPNSGRDANEVLELEVTAGQRLRYVWAWDGCAIADTGVAPVPVAVDFDLFLYHVESGNYVWASQSADDNNEGLDYTIPAGEGGTYRVYVAWEKDATSCEGGTEEPAGFSWYLL